MLLGSGGGFLVAEPVFSEAGEVVRLRSMGDDCGGEAENKG